MPFDKTKKFVYTLAMHVGQIIHNIRAERKMTLVELSRRSGVALASLSRIENAKMTGTLKSHINIANALEVSLPELYKNLGASEKQVEIDTRKSRTDVSVRNKGASLEMLAAKTQNKKMLPVLLKISPGGTTHKEQTRPGVEKFIYVLDGKIEASIGDERYNLTRDDTLYFESSLPYYFKGAGKGEAKLLVVTCPPVI
jgi:transcriptional regulator with XRE-family HTH domain